MREDLVAELRELCAIEGRPLTFGERVRTRIAMSAAAAALEAAREYVAEADRRVGEQFNNAQRSEAYALEKAAETLTMTRELEAALEDAERYRWLRDGPNHPCCVPCAYAVMPGDVEYPTPLGGATLDAAIDQARGKGVAG